MTKSPLAIYWCRSEFRLLDNPALFHSSKYALENNSLFLPLSFLDTNLIESQWMNIGTNRRKLLSTILAKYTENFQSYHIHVGGISDFFRKLTSEYQLTVFVNNDGEPYARKRFVEIHTLLSQNDSQLKVIEDYFSVNRDTLSGSGSIYSVFTPYRNTVLDSFLDSKTLPKPNLDDLKYLTLSNSLPIKDIYNTISQPNVLLYGNNNKLNLDNQMQESNLESWFVSEQESLEHFEKFAVEKILNYKTNRDSLENDTTEEMSTSKMSQSLKFGLVSSRTLKSIILKYHTHLQLNESVFQYVSELIWREFYRYILWHHPSVLELEFQPKYRNTIKWVEEKEAHTRFQKWILGQTGYPLVDAAMIQIAQIGWMHNRARMMVASILTKNLGVDWRWGQDYFRRQLVDLDEASNNGGWQWAASVGADPKPIRIFNPYLQAEKYDPQNTYQKKWLPKDYSAQPIVEHKQAREEALKRYGLAKTINPKSIRDF